MSSQVEPPERERERSPGSHPDEPTPLFLPARVFSPESGRWVSLWVAVTLPVSSLEDYTYRPPHPSNGGGNSNNDTSSSSSARQGMTMYLYVQLRASGAKDRAKHKAATSRGHSHHHHRAVTPPASPGPPGGPGTATRAPSHITRGRQPQSSSDALDSIGGGGADETPPVSTGEGGSSGHHHHHSASAASSPRPLPLPPLTWVKLKVRSVLPRAAAQALSSEMRAGLQLRLVDSDTLTYTSHGTPRAGGGGGSAGASPADHHLSLYPRQTSSLGAASAPSSSASPNGGSLGARRTHAAGGQQQATFLTVPGSLGSRRAVGGGSASPAHSASPPLSMATTPRRAPNARPPLERANTVHVTDLRIPPRHDGASSLGGSGGRAVGAGTGAGPATAQPLSPPPRSPTRLIHALNEATPPSHPHATTTTTGGRAGGVRHSTPPLQHRVPARAVVGSMAELYEIEVRAVVMAEDAVSPAELKVLSTRGQQPRRPPSGPSPTAPTAGCPLTTRKASGRRGSSGHDNSSFSAALNYRRVKDQFLSLFGANKKKKEKRPARKQMSVSSSSPRNSRQSASAPLKPRASPKRHKPTISGGDSKNMGKGKPLGRSPHSPGPPLAPPSPPPPPPRRPPPGKATFRLQLLRETDYLTLLRWAVWVRSARLGRRRHERASAEHAQGRVYVSYDPRDIAADEERAAHDSDSDSDDDDDGERGRASNDCHSHSGGGGGDSGTGLSLLRPQADRRWVNYVRRAADPRTELPFAKIPVFLWRSFLPLSQHVVYRCERGYLAIEAAEVRASERAEDSNDNNDDGSGSGSGALADGGSGTRRRRRLATAQRALSPLRAARNLQPGAALAHSSSPPPRHEGSDRGGGGGSNSGGDARRGPFRHRRRTSWDTVKLFITSPAGPAPPGGFLALSNPSSFIGASSGGGTPATTLPAVSTPAHHHTTAGAQFKDCFLCLTESHLLFYNSFAELKAHFALSEVETVLFSACMGGGPQGKLARELTLRCRNNTNDRDSDNDDDSAEGQSEPHLPASYPFVCFRIRPGKDELNEPPLLCTFTLLPLVPHQLGDPAIPTPADEQNNAGTGSSSEDLDAYEAHLREEQRQLEDEEADFLSVLRAVIPHSADDTLTFDAYVAGSLRRASEPPPDPGTPLYGRYVAARAARQVEFVCIRQRDITAMDPSEQLGGGGSREESVASIDFTTAGGGDRDGSLSVSAMDVADMDAVATPSRRESVSLGYEEHRRLHDAFANSFAQAHQDGTTVVPALSLQQHQQQQQGEVIRDYDLGVRMATHPVPLFLDKEDLFLPPIGHSFAGPSGGGGGSGFFHR